MLISLGANYRAEASSNPTILKDAARERSRRSMELKKAQEKYEKEQTQQPTTNGKPQPRGIPKRKM
jgi:hypothetical protein